MADYDAASNDAGTGSASESTSLINLSFWDLAGIHGINKYVWHLLQTQLGWSTPTYGGFAPITTPQQEPEFNAINAPYLVYTYSKTPTGDDWWLEGEIAAYTVYSQSESDIRRVVNMLVAKLNRADDTADEINDYLKVNGTTDQKAFDYKSIAVSSATGAQPAIQEGGRHDGLIVIRYTYTHYDPTTGLSVRY